MQQDEEFGISPIRGLLFKRVASLPCKTRGGSLMSVVPSIIVLVITALLVFRRELTTRPAAPASKLTPGAKRRSLRQSEPRIRPPA
jgi:hypothetical protein